LDPPPKSLPLQRLAGVFALALAARLFCLWEVGPMPFTYALVGDAASFWAWAGRLAGGDWLGKEVYYQAPLYAWFLGVVRVLFGERILAAYLAQALLGALACAVLASAGAALLSPRAGLLAGVLLALYPPAIFFDGILQKESLAVVLCCGLLWCLSRLEARIGPRPRTALLLGALLGLLALTRENTMVWIPLLAVWLLVQGHGRRAAALRACALTAGVLLVLLPVALRNYAVGRELVLATSNLGPNLYIGNGPDADGTYVPLRPGRANARFEREDANALASKAEGRALTAGEVSRHWTRRTLAWISAHPGAWLRSMAHKALLFWNAYELPDTQDYEFSKRWSWLLRGGGAVWHFGVLFPLALLGVLLAGRREQWVLHALVLSQWAAVSAFFLFARYRLPIVPVLALFAAAGLCAAWDRRAEQGRALLGPLLAAVGAIALANLPLHPRERHEAMALYNWGVVLQQQGHPAEAAQRFRGAVEVDPDLAEAHYNLGTHLWRAHRPDEAQRALLEAVRARPAYSEAWNTLGLARWDLGDLRGAEQAFLRSAAEDPQNVKAAQNLARLRQAASALPDAASGR
jgi:4-amino-4-deoxy-L-arabinose transferase-like glycosyltransferase